jgi:hypothetical protein
MHSASVWSSHSERSSGLPCMRWTLRRLRVVLVPVLLPIVLVPVLLPVGEQRGRPEQRRWVWR